jgi:hypothetical protein
MRKVFLCTQCAVAESYTHTHTSVCVAPAGHNGTLDKLSRSNPVSPYDYNYNALVLICMLLCVSVTAEKRGRPRGCENGIECQLLQRIHICMLLLMCVFVAADEGGMPHGVVVELDVSDFNASTCACSYVCVL